MLMWNHVSLEMVICGDDGLWWVSIRWCCSSYARLVPIDGQARNRFYALQANKEVNPDEGAGKS